MLRKLLLVSIIGSCVVPSAWGAPSTKNLSVAPGFHLEIVSADVRGAREIALGDRGTVFLGSMGLGKVYAVSSVGNPGKAVQVRTVASALETPSGVAFHDGDLYIAEPERLLVLRDIEAHLDDPPKPEVITDHLPFRDGDHFWKFIAFGPDGRLYVTIGAPCNICGVGHDFGKIISMKPDGTDRQDVAYGIRNSVGLAWRKTGKNLWFTDNGRDMMGDDVPSDELNTLTRPQQSFGYPYCHQGDVPDPHYGTDHSCGEFTPPVLKLGAHVAALGLRFYEGPAASRSLTGALLIAEHGSWNRSVPSGYQVVTVKFDSTDHPQQPEPLIWGFRRNGRTFGRPADVQPMPDGSILVSDDFSGSLYRLTYTSAVQK